MNEERETRRQGEEERGGAEEGVRRERKNVSKDLLLLLSRFSHVQLCATP